MRLPGVERLIAYALDCAFKTYYKQTETFLALPIADLRKISNSLLSFSRASNDTFCDDSYIYGLEVMNEE